MARGTTLVRLLDMLRAETRASLNSAHNRQMRDVQVAQLQQAQSDLWEDYDWPFLNIHRLLRLTAGTYLYDRPDDIELDAIQQIELRYGGVWVPVHRGIGGLEYSSYDSLLDERSWPIEKWDISEGEQIEVWPRPSDSGTSSDYEGYLKIYAKKPLSPLVDDDDRTTLDDRLIVLYAAMHLNSGEELKKTSDKFKKRLADMRQNMANNEPVKLFGSEPKGRELKGPPRVHYRVNET